MPGDFVAELPCLPVNKTLNGFVGESASPRLPRADGSIEDRGGGVCGVKPETGGRTNELLEPGGLMGRVPPGRRAAAARGLTGATVAPANAARLSCGISTSGGGGIGAAVSGTNS